MNDMNNVYKDGASFRPEQSCDVFIITKCGYMSCVHYNKEVDAFNCSDPRDTSCAFNDVLAWAYRGDVYDLVSLQSGVDIKQKIAEYYDIGSWD